MPPDRFRRPFYENSEISVLQPRSPSTWRSRISVHLRRSPSTWPLCRELSEPPSWRENGDERFGWRGWRGGRGASARRGPDHPQLRCRRAEAEH